MKKFKARITTLYWCYHCDYFFHGDSCPKCGGIPDKLNTEVIK